MPQDPHGPAKMTNLLCDLTLACLSTVPDPRMDRTKRYPLVYLLFAALCTFVTGGNSFYDMEDFSNDCKDFLDDVTGYSPDYVPSHDTFARVFQLLSNEGMRQLLRDIAYIISESIPDNHKIEGLACDGKALRGTIDDENKILYVLNVWSTKYDLCVYQIPISTKTNEITAMPNALRLLNIKGKVITFDALNTQKKIIAYISDNGAYYIASLKENHKYPLRGWLPHPLILGS